MDKEPYNNKLLKPDLENKSAIALTKRHAYDLEQRVDMLKKLGADQEATAMEMKLEHAKKFGKR